jgi:hypothetical protein
MAGSFTGSDQHKPDVVAFVVSARMIVSFAASTATMTNW